MEGFLSVAMEWKEKLARIIEGADEEEELDDDIDASDGLDNGGSILF